MRTTDYRHRRQRVKFLVCLSLSLLSFLFVASREQKSTHRSHQRRYDVLPSSLSSSSSSSLSSSSSSVTDYNNHRQGNDRAFGHSEEAIEETDNDIDDDAEESKIAEQPDHHSVHKRAPNKKPSGHRIGGAGTGASKQLGFMNENVVTKLRELGEKRQKEISASNDDDFDVSSSSSFKGSFVMNRRRRKINEEIPFPRKKLRDTLQHYSLGKAKKGLIGVIPEEDEVRLTLLGENRNSFNKKGACAVIGNGGTLLAYDLGKEIDSADVIIRLNAGPIKGFEKKVGSRTDYRLVNRLHMGFRETKEEMVLQHCTTPDALDEWTRFKVKHEDDVNVKKKLFAIDPDFHELAISYTDKGVVSNGFYGLLLATELCDEVKVYGFFRRWKGNVYYHYYNSEAPNEGQLFRDDKEGDRLEAWLKERHTTHKMGEPCLQEDESIDEDDVCKNCAPGLVCTKTAWHPVPKPGYCYDEKHPETPANAKGMPRANCARRCDSSHSCPGGKRGFCSASIMESAECIFY
jgi:hypothetical protein